MGLFGNRKEFKAKAEEYTKLANKEAKSAREEAKKAAAYKKSLKSGSDDPAADRYLFRQHDSNRRIYEANARDLRKGAEFQRKRWF